MGSLLCSVVWCVVVMVTLNLVIGSATPEKQADRLCKSFSAILLDPKIPKCPVTSEVVLNDRLGEVQNIRKSHRKSKKSPFYSSEHLKPGSYLRLSGGEAPASRRSLDFSSIPQKYSIPYSPREKSESPSITVNLKSSSVEERTEQIIYKCEICGVASSSEQKMERHRRFHGTSGSSRKTALKSVFKCSLCRKTFNQFAKLIIHKYNHPKSLKSNDLCNLCKARFDDISRHHLEVHINNTNTSEEENEAGEEIVI